MEGAGSVPAAKAQCSMAKPASANTRSLADALEHMAEFEMSQFVRENGKDLFARMLLQQCVEEDDALGLAETGEISIAMGSALDASHDEKAFEFEAAFGEQRRECSRASAPPPSA